MASLRKIEGVGEAYAKKLAACGIRTTNALLKNCSTPKGRKEIAEATGINEKLVLRYTNQADLFRIKGVGEEYADLLEAAGVDTVPELAQRNPDNLHAKIMGINEQKKLVRQPPAVAQVRSWVAQAKDLPRVINY